MSCEKCAWLASKTTPAPAQFLIMGCRKHRKEIGLIADLAKAKKCDDYKQRGI